MKLNEVKKIIKENYKQSSLNVIPFRSIREKFDIPNDVNDLQMMGAAKAANFEIFGSSGMWANIKNK